MVQAVRSLLHVHLLHRFYNENERTSDALDQALFSVNERICLIIIAVINFI
jgi:hypothetical protein